MRGGSCPTAGAGIARMILAELTTPRAALDKARMAPNITARSSALTLWA